MNTSSGKMPKSKRPPAQTAMMPQVEVEAEEDVEDEAAITGVEAEAVVVVVVVVAGGDREGNGRDTSLRRKTRSKNAHLAAYEASHEGHAPSRSHSRLKLLACRRPEWSSTIPLYTTCAAHVFSSLLALHDTQDHPERGLLYSVRVRLPQGASRLHRSS
jgi:hypothetical protein